MTPNAHYTPKRFVSSLGRFGIGTSAQWELCSTPSKDHAITNSKAASSSSSDPASQDPPPVIIELDELKPVNKIRRVPPHFKAHKLDVYQPIIVSLGPYHHGKPEYRLAQDFKKVSLNVFLSMKGRNQDFFYQEIMSRITEVRNCYEKVEYKNNDLASLMLLDACFFIFTMNMKKELTSSVLSPEDVQTYYNYFGIGAMNLIDRNLLLLENQILFWIIKLLICSPSGQGQPFWNNLLLVHMNRATSMQLQTLPWENEKYEPFHYLDAFQYYYMMPIKDLENRNKKTPINGDTNLHFPSVTDLKANGIRLKPGEYYNPSICFSSGQLTLPPIFVSVNFFVLFTNFLAYEIFPTSNTKRYATTYVNFMKSLIQTPNDVKILREESILFPDIGNDMEVVKIIKDLHTFEVERYGVFLELKDSITHYSRRWSRLNTWKAELINVYFRSPWSTIAVLAASALLVMTFLQTVFTIHRRNEI